MGIFDKIRGSAKKAVDQHGDKITSGLDKAAGAIDKKTGGKYTEKIDKGVGKAKEGLDKLDGKNDGKNDGGESTPTR
ncbi:MAG: antitoxin [Propionibacteriales bacterium]|nr:antitoxin [Propionibacteriales bacterium]